MAENQITQNMKRHTVLVALKAERSDLEIARFLKVARSFVHKVRQDLQSDNGTVSKTAKRKENSTRFDKIRTDDFVKEIKQTVDANPRNSMRSLAKHYKVSEGTIRNVVHENMGYKSYALKKGQFLSQKMKENRLLKSKLLLNKFKDPATQDLVWFFSDEKNFDQDQKVNRRNDRWLCEDSSEVPIVMLNKFPASVMVLGVVSSEGHVMPPHFFAKGLKVNSAVYIEVLKTVVKPWIDSVRNGRLYVFQQDSAPSHKARLTQEWMAENFNDHVTPDTWPPNSPDLNPLDYYVWGVVEKEVNEHFHNTLDSLKATILRVMSNMSQDHLVKACMRFRSRVEAVIQADGGFFE